VAELRLPVVGEIVTGEAAERGSIYDMGFSYVKPLPVGKAGDGFGGPCAGGGRRHGLGGV
jgi:hypothetical protein